MIRTRLFCSSLEARDNPSGPELIDVTALPTVPTTPVVTTPVVTTPQDPTAIAIDAVVTGVQTGVDTYLVNQVGGVNNITKTEVWTSLLQPQW